MYLLISQSFYNTHFCYIETQALKSLFSIECAYGNLFTHLGYVGLSFEVPVRDTEMHTCLCLVVSDSKYNGIVPVLLGTNILTRLMAQCCEKVCS